MNFFNIDCFEYMKTLPDGSIDAIVTDPPYGIAFNGVTSNTDWDIITDYKNFITNFLFEAKRVIKDDGTIWLFCARTEIRTVFQAIEDAGLKCNMQNWLTYARQKGRGTKNKLKSQAEEVLHITKGKQYTWHPIEYLRECVIPYVKDGKPRGWFIDQNTGERLRWSGVGNVLCFTSPFFNSKFEKQIHSTQKPVLLIAELILLSSKPGEVIFDPFAGSGSCGIAAQITDRKWIGCELDEDMYNKANNWLNSYDKELAKEYIQHRVR